MISDKFPTVGKVNLATYELCDCPRRREPSAEETTLPVPATEANSADLQKHLVRIYAQSTFNTCSHQPLSRKNGPPQRLMFDEDATPFTHPIPNHVATHWQDEVKAGLDEDVPPDAYLTGNAIDRIRRVERLPHRPSKRGPPPQDGIRHCMGTLLVPIDATRVHTCPERAIDDDTARSFQPLVTRPSASTTRYYGQVRSRGATSRQSNGWIYVAGMESSSTQISSSSGNPQWTFQASRSILTNVRPCSRYLEAIRDFPEPRNINNVRSWFRLVNQVIYAFSVAERMHPFRTLLKNGERITWWPELEDIFRESKDAIVQEIEHDVRIFEKTKFCVLVYFRHTLNTACNIESSLITGLN